MRLEEQADQVEGAAATNPILPAVQAFKEARAAWVLKPVAHLLEQVGVVLGLQVPQARRVWLVMAGTGTSCRSPQS